MIDTQIERMMDADKHNPVRSLASLTDDEARTLFALAFGYGPVAEHFHYGSCDKLEGFAITLININDGLHCLSVFENGYILAYKTNGKTESQAGFNARKVLIYLALLGVHFDEEENGM